MIPPFVATVMPGMKLEVNSGSGAKRFVAPSLPPLRALLTRFILNALHFFCIVCTSALFLVDRSWVYTVPADFADGEAKRELLAIRFMSTEEAQEFKVKFEEALKINGDLVGKSAATPKKDAESKKDEGDGKESAAATPTK